MKPYRLDGQHRAIDDGDCRVTAVGQRKIACPLSVPGSLHHARYATGSRRFSCRRCDITCGTAILVRICKLEADCYLLEHPEFADRPRGLQQEGALGTPLERALVRLRQRGGHGS